jgi:DNA-binding CsgD family transcriptional regulator
MKKRSPETTRRKRGRPSTASLNRILSIREEEILSMLYAGKTYQQVADLCFIHISTVRKHVNNIYVKLNAHTSKEAARKYFNKN